jgi:hypothetical protein
MAELNYKADILDWVETWTFNAPKCMAVFKGYGTEANDAQGPRADDRAHQSRV